MNVEADLFGKSNEKKIEFDVFSFFVYSPKLHSVQTECFVFP